MLASITEGVPDALKQLGAEEGLPFLAENKYDGIRAQVRLCLHPNIETLGDWIRRRPTPLDTGRCSVASIWAALTTATLRGLQGCSPGLEYSGILMRCWGHDGTLRSCDAFPTHECFSPTEGIILMQIHLLKSGSVSVFSRNCEDRSQAFPDVATAICSAAEGLSRPRNDKGRCITCIEAHARKSPRAGHLQHVQLLLMQILRANSLGGPMQHQMQLDARVQRELVWQILQDTVHGQKWVSR